MGKKEKGELKSIMFLLRKRGFRDKGDYQEKIQGQKKGAGVPSLLKKKRMSSPLHSHISAESVECSRDVRARENDAP